MTKKKKKPQNKKDRLWAEAKRRCRLNDNDVQIAKELGLNPALNFDFFINRFLYGSMGLPRLAEPIQEIAASKRGDTLQ